MRVLVTGGAGFIGAHVVNRLLAEPSVEKVTSLDVEHPLSATPDNEGQNGKVEKVWGDITDRETCDRYCATADTVIHLAAVASVPASVADPAHTTLVNVTGTFNLLEASRNYGVDQFLFASTSALYGNGDAAMNHEGLPPRTLSPYAASKLAGESYCLTYGHVYDLKATAFRLFNVFGPGQDADHPYAAVIPRFLSAIRSGQALQLHGDGGQTRDFVSVHTVADAMVKTCTRGLQSSEPINIANGSSIALTELINYLEVIHQRTLRIRRLEPRTGDVRHSRANIERIMKFIPDVRRTSFLPDLAQTYDWYLDK